MTEPTVEWLALAGLKAHPRNYVQHPADQIEHLRHSLAEHGWYRNLVIARDGTLLAGHGMREAALGLGLAHAPCIRLDLDPLESLALKVLTGDNELRHLVERDDRALSELLKEISLKDATGLAGTGYDAAMLANLAFVTRPAQEVKDFDAAAHWAGMPEYAPPADDHRVIIRFRSPEDRAAFEQQTGIRPAAGQHMVWWPDVGKEDLRALHFAAAEA